MTPPCYTRDSSIDNLLASVFHPRFTAFCKDPGTFLAVAGIPAAFYVLYTKDWICRFRKVMILIAAGRIVLNNLTAYMLDQHSVGKNITADA
jgi:hypothetical protein